MGRVGQVGLVRLVSHVGLVGRLTLFLEAINVANRTNTPAALPSINRRTFEATGLFEQMVPLVPSVGILLEF